MVRFPNLSDNDVIVPRSARLAFNLHKYRFQNLGGAIIKKTTIRISGNEVISIDDSDIYHCYVDLWKSSTERTNMAYQGIGKSNRVGAGNAAAGAEDEAIAKVMQTGFASYQTLKLETHTPSLRKHAYSNI